MPSAIPDRFRLETRLGRDDDIEEWLATDISLDRPVLVRSLGPESTPERRVRFIEDVSRAAKVTHPHLVKVFNVSQVDGGAYSVSEWTGGSSLADHVDAGQPIELVDFLPNASGLAGALAELHEHGITHGGISASAISYRVSHAAKLGAFGRAPRSKIGDVGDLGAALETALTGLPIGGPAPSETIDGVPRAIDRILRSAQQGEMTAHELEEALGGAPTPRTPRPEPHAGSRRLLVSAVALVLIAVALVAVGRALSGGTAPIIPPVSTTADAAPAASPPAPATATRSQTAVVDNLNSYDPQGGGGESDSELPNLIDDDVATTWSTESYDRPLGEVKDGVGVAFTLLGSPSRLEIIGATPGTSFEVYWADTFFARTEDWSRLAGGRTPPGAISLDLPPRHDGFWLVWLTDLPSDSEGTFSASIAEVRFLP